MRGWPPVIRRRLLLCSVTALALLAFGASASAATRYVGKTGADETGGISNDCLQAASPCLTLTHASQVAEAADTVSVSGGTYFGQQSVTKPVTIIGQEGARFEAPISGAPPLIVSGAGVILRNAIVVGRAPFQFMSGGPEPTVNPAIEVTGASASLTLEGVAVGQDGPAEGGAAIRVNASAALAAQGSTVTGNGEAGILALSGSKVSVGGSTVADALAGEGAIEANGSTIVVDGSTLSGDAGVDVGGGSTTLTRDVVRAQQTGVLQGGSAQVAIRDSLIAPAPGGHLASGDWMTSSGTLTVVGSTLYATDGGSGTPPEPVAVRATGGGVQARIANSILGAAGAHPVGILAQGAAGSWTVSHTSFASSNGAGVPAPGSGTNVAAAPAFADQAAGDYHLTEAATAMIDAGDPAEIAPGELDLDGAPRTGDGNCDGAAAPDLGAYELARVPCPGPPGEGGGGGAGAGGSSNSGKGAGGAGAEKPTITAVSVKQTKAGPVLHFSVDLPGTVKISLSRVVTRKVKGKKKKVDRPVATIARQVKSAGPQTVPLASQAKAVGTYKVTLVATSGAAASAPGRATFRVVAP
jgi:hypothetical protein